MEDDLIKLSRYIEFSEDNFSVYSVELTRLYLSACSEIDAVLKLICKEISPEGQPRRIPEYYEIIDTYHFGFKEDCVNVLPQGLGFCPWQQWEDKSAPDWWQKHNGVKHDRTGNFKDANLNNSLNALCGLFVVLYYLCQIKGSKESPLGNVFVDQLFPKPQILRFPDSFRYSDFGYGH